MGLVVMIRRIANLVDCLDGLSFLASLVFGIGCLGYVAIIWVMHFASNGQYLIAAASAIGVLLVSALAAARVPIALWLFFGAVVVLGTAFLGGMEHVVMP